MLEKITPLILTYNEAPNIARTLDRLSWAREILIVDSFSDDETLEIVAAYPQVRVLQRAFTTFADQCNYGLKSGNIVTEWILNLDADYVVTEELVEELNSLAPGDRVVGYQCRFVYCVDGKRLRSGVYPPVTVLFRKEKAEFVSDGHAHRVRVSGEVRRLEAPILHDDRKPLSRWFTSQARYAALEADKLSKSDAHSLSRADRIRKWMVVAPALVLFYCLFIKRGLLDGLPGIYYAFQRTVAELMLSVELLHRGVSSDSSSSPATLIASANAKKNLEVQGTEL